MVSLSSKMSDGALVTVKVEYEQVRMDSMYERRVIDPKWQWVDPAGHKHDGRLQNAHWKLVRTWYCEDCWEEHEEFDLVCRYCGVKVVPHMIPDPSPPYMRGLAHGTLVVETPDGLRSEYALPPEALPAVYAADGGWDEAWVRKWAVEERLIGRTFDSRRMTWR